MEIYVKLSLISTFFSGYQSRFLSRIITPAPWLQTRQRVTSQIWSHV